MSRFRILEKKGKSVIRKEIVLMRCNHRGIEYGQYGCSCRDIEKEFKTYIPRFIVQEQTCAGHDNSNQTGPFGRVSVPESWKDLKEFTSLEEARQYKRELELEEGIVRE